MPNPNAILYLSIAITLVAIIVLALINIFKAERMRQMQLTIDHLKNSLDQMDEQAKLIVRTDLELNKIQEELDKKISELYTLQELSHAFTTTLDEREIFNQIKTEYIEELGMQKALGLIWQEKEQKFLLYLALGYLQKDLDRVTVEVDSNAETYLKLIKEGKTISSRSAETEPISGQEIKRLFEVKAFCLSPIVPKEGAHGFLFVGTTSDEVPITEGDEELITILAHSIGQALENARLFEATWRAQQELERRVEQRTRELTEVVEE
ncbi:MAG: hypothetical protein KKC53_07345, partial [Actinobacteria bacterium]|nr:hypothetical protein [Actinomycetota bacterium]